ncbi:MAG: ribosomal protein S18-alanine N-acetyltransferase [Clostridia bacterium]|nr:ribosomal protein S18-alanine N-acetyltransferase [Clostridia bacterium]
MKIHRMTAKDIDSVAAVDRQCFSIPWSRQSFAEEMENEIAVYFTASEDGQIIGYCGFWIVADEGDITNIAVLPQYRRRGVGSRLLETMIAEAQSLSLELLTLEVRRSNEPAKQLYSSYGFKQIGERRRYYSDNNEDALIMMKTLKDKSGHL